MKLIFNLIISISIFSFGSAKDAEVIQAFSKIYESHGWGSLEDGFGSSGTGSNRSSTEIYRNWLQDFLKKNTVRSVVDLGCGDWELSKLLDWTGIEYLGLDASKKIVDRNNSLYKKENISFNWSTGEFLPYADLLICKDVFQHLPTKNIKSIQKQFYKFRCVLITNDCLPDDKININIKVGESRPIDMSTSPFFATGTEVLRYQVLPSLEIKSVFLIERSH